MTNEEIIAKFLKVINQWIKEGCPKDNKYLFTESFALCANLQNYLIFEHLDRHYECYMYFQTELLKGKRYPFNSSIKDYKKELTNNSRYVNSKRLAFITLHMEK